MQVLYDDQYGTICNNNWDYADAFVVCRALGFLGAEDHAAKFDGVAPGDVLLDAVECDGTEASLANCTHSGWNNNKCDHSQDVGVVCREGRCMLNTSISQIDKPRIHITVIYYINSKQKM